MLKFHNNQIALTIAITMKPISFLARGTKPAPLPDWILNQLTDMRNPSVPARFPDPVKTLMHAALESSGLSESDLLEQVSREIDIDPKSCMIYKALLGKCGDDAFQKRINRILHVSDEQWQESLQQGMHQHQEMLEKTRKHDNLVHAHQDYRMRGPFLRVLKRASPRISFSMQVHYIHRRDLTVDMHGVDEFLPPSAEEMGTMIANQPDSCSDEFFHKEYVREQLLCGGFRYHRLPDEVHTYDAQGKLYASGGALTPNPPGTCP